MISLIFGIDGASLLEFISNPLYLAIAWLLLAVTFLLVELSTPGMLYFVAFAIGTIIASFLAMIGCTLALQCGAALVVSMICFGIFKRYFAGSAHQVIRTNMQGLLKSQGIVTETIKPHRLGRVKIRGEEWPAQVEDAVELQKGTLVEVIGFEGNRLLVRSVKHH